MPLSKQTTHLVATVDRRYTKHVIDHVFKQLVALPKEQLIAIFNELDIADNRSQNAIDAFYQSTVGGCAYAVLQTRHNWTKPETIPAV